MDRVSISQKIDSPREIDSGLCEDPCVWVCESNNQTIYKEMCLCFSSLRCFLHDNSIQSRQIKLVGICSEVYLEQEEKETEKKESL